MDYNIKNIETSFLNSNADSHWMEHGVNQQEQTYTRKSNLENQLSIIDEEHYGEKDIEKILENQKNVFESLLLKAAEPIFQIANKSTKFERQDLELAMAQIADNQNHIFTLNERTLIWQSISTERQELKSRIESTSKEIVSLKGSLSELEGIYQQIRQQLYEKKDVRNRIKEIVQNTWKDYEKQIISNLDCTFQNVGNLERNQVSYKDIRESQIQRVQFKIDHDISEGQKEFKENINNIEKCLNEKINTTDVKALFTSMNSGFYDDINSTLVKIEDQINKVGTLWQGMRINERIQKLEKEILEHYFKLDSRISEAEEIAQREQITMNQLQQAQALVQDQRSRIDCLEGVVENLVREKQELVKRDIEMERKAEILQIQLEETKNFFASIQKTFLEGFAFSSQKMQVDQSEKSTCQNCLINLTNFQNQNSQITLLSQQNDEFKQKIHIKEKILTESGKTLISLQQKVHEQAQQLQMLQQELEQIKQEKFDKKITPFPNSNMSMVSSIISMKSQEDKFIDSPPQELFKTETQRKNNSSIHHLLSQDPISPPASPNGIKDLAPLLRNDPFEAFNEIQKKNNQRQKMKSLEQIQFSSEQQTIPLINSTYSISKNHFPSPTSNTTSTQHRNISSIFSNEDTSVTTSSNFNHKQILSQFQHRLTTLNQQPQQTINPKNISNPSHSFALLPDNISDTRETLTSSPQYHQIPLSELDMENQNLQSQNETDLLNVTNKISQKYNSIQRIPFSKSHNLSCTNFPNSNLQQQHISITSNNLSSTSEDKKLSIAEQKTVTSETEEAEKLIKRSKFINIV